MRIGADEFAREVGRPEELPGALRAAYVEALGESDCRRAVPQSERLGSRRTGDL